MSKPLNPEDLNHVLEHTRELWEEIRGCRIFVTGGTGFFGCWLLETFTCANNQFELGADLVALTRDPEAFGRKAPHLAKDPSIRLWKGDVREFEFPPGEFSHVIHAATTSDKVLPPLEMIDTLTLGTRRVLEFAMASGAQKFLLTSSGAVYGRQPSEMTHIPENYAGAPDPTDPNASYAEGKRMAELLCAIYNREYGVETKVARCFAFCGPHIALGAHFAVGNFIRDALTGGPIRVKGDGTPCRSYLYAADLAIWLWTLLFRGAVGMPYNVGSEEAVSIGELASVVARTCEPEVKVIVDKPAVPGAPVSRYVCACERARALGLRTWIPLPEQIRRTIAWQKGHIIDRE
jgi:dTDP-glucose 4,6-dehydratase